MANTDNYDEYDNPVVFRQGGQRHHLSLELIMKRVFDNKANQKSQDYELRLLQEHFPEVAPANPAQLLSALKNYPDFTDFQYMIEQQRLGNAPHLEPFLEQVINGTIQEQDLKVEQGEAPKVNPDLVVEDSTATAKADKQNTPFNTKLTPPKPFD